MLMRIVLAIVALLVSAACRPRQPLPSDFVILEGSGISGVCLLGQNPSVGAKALRSQPRRTSYGDSVLQVEYAFSQYGLTVDAVACTCGRGECIARVSVLCAAAASAQNTARARQPATQHVLPARTAAGLQLRPSAPAREAIVRIYGLPVRQLGSWLEPTLVLDVANGVSFSGLSSPSAE
jgi:hypothetical protein